MKSKWFINTVIIGLIPIMIRIIIFLFLKDKSWNYLASSIDLIFFGLVLNLTNINELTNKRDIKNWDSRDHLLGVSIVFLVIFASTLGILYLSDQAKIQIVDLDSILLWSIVLAVIAFFVSFAIIYKLNTQKNENS